MRTFSVSFKVEVDDGVSTFSLYSGILDNAIQRALPRYRTTRPKVKELGAKKDEK